MTCALKAASNEVFLTAQALEGQVDADPVWQKFRRTDGRVGQQNSFEKSSELKADLQATKNTLTDVAYSNTFSVEVTQNIMLLARSILMNNVETPVDVTAATISFDETANEIEDSGAGFTDVVEGQWVFVTGANNAALNKPYYVVSRTNSILTVIDVPFDELAGADITMVGTMLRSGNTAHLLSVQGRDEHTGATDDTDYRTQIDAVVDTFSITVPETGIMTGSSDIIAATQLPDLEPVSGQTDAPVDESDVLGSAVNFTGFFPDQITTENNFTDVTIDIIRNTGIQNAAGKLGAKCVAQDIIAVTGTLTSLRRASDPAEEEDKFDNSVRFNISFGFLWPDGKSLIITMRRMIYTDGSIASATGEFANFAGTYDAEQDEFGTTIQFDTDIEIAP